MMLAVSACVAPGQELQPEPTLVGRLLLPSGSGSRGVEVIIETAEPNIEDVLAAYPEGEYIVMVKTVYGDRLLGTAELLHDLLPAPLFSPAAGELVDPDSDLVVTWDPVAGATAYTIEIEQDDLDVNITAKLDGDATSLIIPADFLVPGTEYEIGITTAAPNGNLSVAEGVFQTEE